MKTVHKIILLAIVLILVVVSVIACSKSGGRKKISVASQASLEKVLEINELQSIEYVYNSYVIDYGDYDLDNYEMWIAITDEVVKYPIKEVDYESVKAGLATLEVAEVQDFTQRYFNTSFEGDMGIYFLQYLSYMVEDSYEAYKIHMNYLASSEYKEKMMKDSEIEKELNRNYAVSYRGTVRAGINEPITFSIDDKAAAILIQIPKVKILSSNVVPDTETMRFLYFKRSGEGDIQKVLKLCEEDLYAKVKDNTAFLELAEQNLIETVKALCLPFKNSTSYEFKFVIKGEEV